MGFPTRRPANMVRAHLNKMPISHFLEHLTVLTGDEKIVRWESDLYSLFLSCLFSRLPFTPATMRRKKPGESVAVVSMSLAGSPIAIREPALALPLKTGNVCSQRLLYMYLCVSDDQTKTCKRVSVSVLACPFLPLINLAP